MKWFLVIFLIAGCRTYESTESNTDLIAFVDRDDDGIQDPDIEHPFIVLFKDVICTMAKVSVDEYLLADHCLLTPIFSNRSTFTLTNHPTGITGYRPFTIAKVSTAQRWRKKISELPKEELPHASFEYPDIVLLKINERFDDIPIAKISLAETNNPASYYITGYGCEKNTKKGTTSIRKVVRTTSLSKKQFKSTKDGLLQEVQKKAWKDIYRTNIVTPGSRFFAKSNPKVNEMIKKGEIERNDNTPTICFGDSGGPLLNESKTIAGVNSVMLFERLSALFNVHPEKPTAFNLHSKISELTEEDGEVYTRLKEIAAQARP